MGSKLGKSSQATQLFTDLSFLASSASFPLLSPFFPLYFSLLIAFSPLDSLTRGTEPTIRNLLFLRFTSDTVSPSLERLGRAARHRLRFQRLHCSPMPSRTCLDACFRAKKNVARNSSAVAPSFLLFAALVSLYSHFDRRAYLPARDARAGGSTLMELAGGSNTQGGRFATALSSGSYTTADQLLLRLFSSSIPS